MGACNSKASLINKRDIDIHDFSVRLKQSHLSLSGKISSGKLELPDAYLKAKGVFKAEEILPLLPEPVPEQYSLEGTSLLQAAFKGNPADSFTMEAVLDLTDSSWEDPYLISKKAGIKDRATVSISRDYSTNSFEGEGDIALESAHVDFLPDSILPAIPISGMWSLKAHLLNFPSLQVLSFIKGRTLTKGR